MGRATQGGKSTNRPRVVYEFGQFRLDREAHLLVTGEKIVALEPKAVEVLLILVEKRGELVPRQDLMSAVWPDTFVEESNLSSNISILRNSWASPRTEEITSKRFPRGATGSPPP